jgi:prevent-host-death family protein
MTKVTASKARENLSDILNRVTYGGERVIIHRRGKDLVAIVPMDDLRLIENGKATKTPKPRKAGRAPRS